MHSFLKNSFIAIALVTVAGIAGAQNDATDQEALRAAAVEALITAPPERALPLARKVVEGDYSEDLKVKALFVLSQIDDAEAQNVILDAARNGSGELRAEAIRMIGIGGNSAALAQLQELYATGDEETRSAVLEAYLISGDQEAIYQVALQAQTKQDFAEAVHMLGAMGATDQLRQLREESTLDSETVSDVLIDAYAISGDFESLRAMAMDNSNPVRQVNAIEGLGIIGGSEADDTLVEIYRGAASNDVRQAALNGMLISGNDEAVLELYRESDNAAEKRNLLEFLVIMDSDSVWEIIDQALDGGA